MTEQELDDKLFTAKQDLNELAIEYSMHVAADKAILKGEKTAIHIGTSVIDVPKDLVYICSTIIDLKQGRLLDLIGKKCSEMTAAIDEYKKEQESDIEE